MDDKKSLMRTAELLADGADPLAAILAGSHSLMVEAFYLASIPEWYDAAFLDALRLQDDGREEGLVERLARYSFIVPLAEAPRDHPAYYVHSQERTALQRRWIAQDPEAYRAAHARALAFWQERPDPNPYAQVQNVLYHLLFVDFQGAIHFLLDRFRDYRNERHLPAIERLLKTAREAQSHLDLLEHDQAAAFQDLLIYLAARLAQLRGDWTAAAEALAPLFVRFDALELSLRPYLLRARAYDLARQGQYAGAIEDLRQALKEFGRPAVAGSRWGIIEAERGYTLVALGDAYVDLAAAASGRGHRRRYDGPGDPRQGNLWARLWPGFNFVVSLPLVLYLGFTLGRRVWHPRFWPALIGLDWIIARLMATGARYYRQADDILEQHGKAAEGLVADEKLAALYLRLGDAAEAERLCRWLLGQEASSVGPYRQALVRVMLADALIGLGRPGEAREPLRVALPVLDEYMDYPREARALELLGEALLATGQGAEAMLTLASASLRYQETGRWLDATRLAEGLEGWLRGKPTAGPAGQSAAEVVQALPCRQYPGSYRHPVLLFFRQFILASLPFVLLLVPLLTMVLETRLALGSGMQFQLRPVLTGRGEYLPALSPALDPAITAANVSSAGVSEAVLKMGSAFVLVYLLSSLLLGLAAIVFTPLTSVEARGRGATVFLDQEAVAVGGAGDGDGEAQQARLPWPDLDCQIQADVCLWGRPLEDRSAFALVGGGQRLIVRGLTAWYSALQRRVSSCRREGSQVQDLSFQIFPSRLGWLYVANLVLVLLLWAIAASPDETLVHLDLPGINYGAADLYPYLFLVLLMAPLWWGVCQPTRQRIHLRPRTRLPLLMLGIGLLLLGIQILLRFRPLLTVVDLYLPLATIAVLLAGEWGLWRARAGGERVHSAALRLGSAPVVLLACLLLGTVMIRDVLAYHALVQGNGLRDRALKEDAGEEGSVLLRRAMAAYDRAERLGKWPIWGLDTRPAARISLGLPAPLGFPWLSARSSRGLLQLRAGLYSEAIATLSEAVDYAPAEHRILLSRAVARALVGRGWAAYLRVQDDPAGAEQHYDAALTDFRRATEVDVNSFEAWLAQGYTRYARSQYKDALPAWERAEQLEPHSPVALFALGLVHWRLGLNAPDRCAEYQQSGSYFQRAAAADTIVPQAPADRALAYRAAAQVQYLVGLYCEGYGPLRANMEAVGLYERAVDLDSQPGYWYRKGSLSHLVASALHESGDPAGACRWLQMALGDLEQALRALPGRQTYLEERASLLRDAATWAEERRAAGDAAEALAYYELLARYMPEEAEGAFHAGMGCLALGDGAGALAWYDEGLRRAAAARDRASSEEALAALYLAVAGDETLPAAPVLALFEAQGIQPGVHNPVAAFELSVAALRAGQMREYARLSNLGLEMAAAAGTKAAARQGAGPLRGYLLLHPEVDPTDVYWPLFQDPLDR
jgi:hypothetical protein